MSTRASTAFSPTAISTRAARVVARVSGRFHRRGELRLRPCARAALEIEAPARAQVIRGVMAELERIANHLGDIGAVCNDAAFALLLAYGGILREKVLAACDTVFGHRLMMDGIVPGGVARDISAADTRTILAMLDDIAPIFARSSRSTAIRLRCRTATCATGFVPADLVAQWGAGGHVGRGSGRDFDCRRDFAYPPYQG